MTKKLSNILLVDDDNDSNFFHERLLNQLACAENIYTAKDGRQALDFLLVQTEEKKAAPSIIFLDLNMPRMDGWEFLEEYQKLNELQHSKTVLIILTASLNPHDLEKAMSYTFVKGFKSKYLDKDGLHQILVEHFNDYL
jgi:CheY-like chemotaxis protein